MSNHSATQDLVNLARCGGDVPVDGSLERPGIIAGIGVPSDTLDVGMLYLNLVGGTSDLVLYVWDDNTSAWVVLTTI